MMIDASAMVAILARRPGSDGLLARLDAAAPPFFTTPPAQLEAMVALARLKAGGRPVTPALLAQARDAVAELTRALGLRDVPVSPDIGRRAQDLAVSSGASASHCLAEACARAYRTELLDDGAA